MLNFVRFLPRGNMTESETQKNGSFRATFPEDEAAHPWLSMLLDAYSIVDQGVEEAIREEEKKGRKLACRRGCSACCRTHITIPVYPLELVGMTWYATEKVLPPIREKLKEQLKNFKDSDACAFLVADECSIYPLRPMACRQFNVLDKVCEEGEDPYYTRRQDVMTPGEGYTNKAFNAMLPFYGAKTRAQRRQVIKSRVIHTKARPMRSCNWPSLSDKMEEYERENPQILGE